MADASGFALLDGLLDTLTDVLDRRNARRRPTNAPRDSNHVCAP